MEYGTGAVPHTSHGSAGTDHSADVHEPANVVRGRGGAAVAYGLALGAAAMFAAAATVSVQTGGSGLSLPQSHHSFRSFDIDAEGAVEGSGSMATSLTSLTSSSMDGSMDGVPSSSSSSSLPHVALVLVDDWGWNDVGYQSTDLGECTPHMDSLAEAGVKLSNYYTQPLCSPARGALLTGKYPIHIGMHHNVIESTSPWGLNLDETLFPEYVAELGYKSYMVGKWHLGHFHAAYLPTQRGFDSFYGFYGNCIGYFSHVSELGACRAPDCFYDLRDGDVPVLDKEGEHTTYILNSEMARVVRGHKQAEDALGETRPMFLYYPVANVHNPILVPDGMLDQTTGGLGACLDGIDNYPRRVYAALTYMLDEAVANMTAVLQETGMYDNTIIVVASDNGANPVQQNTTTPGGSGSNYPLRGMKGYMFDGGVRVPAFVHSPLLPAAAAGTTFTGLFHVADWLPTLVGGAMGGASLYKHVQYFDGIDQWDAITLQTTDDDGSATHPRTTVLINIDDMDGAGCSQSWATSAIRMGDWKLITNEADLPIWPVVSTKHVPTEFTIDWGGTMNWYLFNVSADPTESTNLMNEHPEIVEELSGTLNALKDTMLSSAYCKTTDTSADTAFNETMFIGPWLTNAGYTCNVTCVEEASSSGPSLMEDAQDPADGAEPPEQAQDTPPSEGGAMRRGVRLL